MLALKQATWPDRLLPSQTGSSLSPAQQHGFTASPPHALLRHAGGHAMAPSALHRTPLLSAMLLVTVALLAAPRAPAAAARGLVATDAAIYGLEVRAAVAAASLRWCGSGRRCGEAHGPAPRPAAAPSLPPRRSPARSARCSTRARSRTRSQHHCRLDHFVPPCRPLTRGARCSTRVPVRTRAAIVAVQQKDAAHPSLQCRFLAASARCSTQAQSRTRRTRRAMATKATKGTRAMRAMRATKVRALLSAALDVFAPRCLGVAIGSCSAGSPEHQRCLARCFLHGAALYGAAPVQLIRQRAVTTGVRPALLNCHGLGYLSVCAACAAYLSVCAACTVKAGAVSLAASPSARYYHRA
jgi:hypothetical protein